MAKRIVRGISFAVCTFLVAVAVVAVLAGWRADVFVDFVRIGWFGFIFARLVALLIVGLALRRLWRSFPRSIAWITSLSILSFGAFAVVKSYSPEGTYGCVGEYEPTNNAPDLAPELYHKDHFWRFSHGKVDDCFGNLCGRYGRYEKTADGWTVIQEVEEPFTWKLQFSVLGFRLIMVEDHGATAFHPRRIIPFARPYWMPDWLQ
jgi:hypothetical protein